MASEQDSLSQSMLAPYAFSCPLETAAGILDDVEMRQSEIMRTINSKGASRNSVYQKTLDSIRDELMKVNQILQSEKEQVSDLRTTLTQCQSQLEYSESQGTIKSKVSLLLRLKKRVVSAFKDQKRIADLPKEKELEANISDPPQQDAVPATHKSNEVIKQVSKAEFTEITREKTPCKSFQVIERKTELCNEFSSNQDTGSPSMTAASNVCKRIGNSLGNTRRLEDTDPKEATMPLYTTMGKVPQDIDIKTAPYDEKAPQDITFKDVLPSLRASSPVPAQSSFDISKIKFVVTVKQEEFQESSKFLPDNFWTSPGFDNITIDEGFLKRVDFL